MNKPNFLFINCLWLYLLGGRNLDRCWRVEPSSDSGVRIESPKRLTGFGLVTYFTCNGLMCPPMTKSLLFIMCKLCFHHHFPPQLSPFHYLFWWLGRELFSFLRLLHDFPSDMHQLWKWFSSLNEVNFVYLPGYRTLRTPMGNHVRLEPQCLIRIYTCFCQINSSCILLQPNISVKLAGATISRWQTDYFPVFVVSHDWKCFATRAICQIKRNDEALETIFSQPNQRIFTSCICRCMRLRCSVDQN